MRPARPLASDVATFELEVNQIVASFSACSGHPAAQGFGMEYFPGEEGCLIALWDAWGRFLRGLVCSSCSKAAQGTGGTTYYAPNPRSESEVLTLLRTRSPGQNFGTVNGEPKWQNAQCLADITAALGLPNAQDIIAAVSASDVVLGPFVVPSPLEQMRLARNFAAHKHSGTWTGLTAEIGHSISSLSDYMREPTRGVARFVEWKDCLVSIANAAAK
jgi:hypothetical protein